MRRWVLAVVVAACSCSKETPPAESVKVQLPKTRSGGESVAVAQVHLEAGGMLQLNGLPVKAEELSGKLRAMREKTPSLEVHLDASPDVPYERVIQALDAANKAGIVDVSVGPKPAEAPQEGVDGGGG